MGGITVLLISEECLSRMTLQSVQGIHHIQTDSPNAWAVFIKRHAVINVSIVLTIFAVLC